MSNPLNSLTTQEFADQAGVSSSTVSKWLRNGTIIGEKTKGKWSIAASELKKILVSANAADIPANTLGDVRRTENAGAGNQPKSYSIEEFSAMTFLTEYGVRQWLKEGRLDKVEDGDGRVRVDGSSLEKSHVKRLVR